jgi:hypothetical protein
MLCALNQDTCRRRSEGWMLSGDRNAAAESVVAAVDTATSTANVMPVHADRSAEMSGASFLTLPDPPVSMVRRAAPDRASPRSPVNAPRGRALV